MNQWGKKKISGVMKRTWEMEMIRVFHYKHLNAIKKFFPSQESCAFLLIQCFMQSETKELTFIQRMLYRNQALTNIGEPQIRKNSSCKSLNACFIYRSIRGRPGENWAESHSKTDSLKYTSALQLGIYNMNWRSVSGACSILEYFCGIMA